MVIRRAFTLVEVLVAVTVLGLLLSATVAVVRSAQVSQAQASAQLEVDTLATATMNQFYALKDGYAAAGNPAALSDLLGGVPLGVNGIFVTRAGIAAPCPSLGAGCPAPAQNGPLLVSWCPLPPATSNGVCASRLAAAPIVAKAPGTPSLAFAMQSNLLDGIPAELIALPTQPGPSARNAYLDASGVVPGTPIVVSAETPATYRFFSRAISVAPIGSATDEAQLQNSVYRITVTVQSVANARTTVTQQALISL